MSAKVRVGIVGAGWEVLDVLVRQRSYNEEEENDDEKV